MAKNKVSVEEKVEEHYKGVLSDLGIVHYGKTSKMNDSISAALENAESKSGGSGNNYPDIRCLLENAHARRIPVMIEAKGTEGYLEKLTKDNEIELVTYWDKDSKEGAKNPHKAGDPKYETIKNYAVNGALHYGLAILDGGYKEVIVIGINGSELDENEHVKNPECKAYYVSVKNNRVPKHIKELDDDWSLLKKSNLDKLYAILDKLVLSEEELEALTRKAEATLEERVKSIHQSLYEDDRLKSNLSTNEKLYLFSGLIMAGLKTEGTASLEADSFTSNDDEEDNDGTIITKRIRAFLKKKKCSADKIKTIMGFLEPVFEKPVLWKPKNGESILKSLFCEVKSDVIPCLESNLRLDFTGKILNSLNDWVSIDNDKQNDVVLTPRYVTTFMAKLAHTDRNSFVWDKAMGSAGFLVSAMDIMIKDAYANIHDEEELEEKIDSIHNKQLLGIEILGNIFILAVLNMILMGDGSSNIINDDSHKYKGDFPANVFLLNPPYSAPGKGFNFVEETLEQMSEGYACILIQDSAGNGQGLPYTKNILKNNTLEASIKMPAGLFGNKASVSVYIFLFKIATPHNAKKLVKFFDMSEDGYSRQNRKKSTQEVNLRNTDHAVERYDEVLARVLGEAAETEYYTKENGKFIEDTVTLNGDDWLFTQHQKIDTQPTEEDFKRTVANYLSWKVSTLMKGAV